MAGTGVPWRRVGPTGLAGPRTVHLHPASYAIVGATSLVGLAATLLWWRWADHR